MKKAELMAWIAENYGAAGEYPWRQYPGYVVFRHAGNRKWFAVVMDIPREKLGMEGGGALPVVNLKCDSRLIGTFRQESGIYPGYHMSKAHWLTVALDGTVQKDKLLFLLNMSYDLTK